MRKVGRLELRPTSQSAACSRPYPAVDLWFLVTRRDRWCPLRSAGRRPDVYPACTTESMSRPVADAPGAEAERLS
jgi:hypothetical protein